jgi:dihydrofolate reductase
MSIGGADLAATFIAHDLIDEFRLYVHPIAIGRGKRLFPETDRQIDVRLVESHTFGNGVVLLRYERQQRRS